jgi:hypothetical protein
MCEPVREREPSVEDSAISGGLANGRSGFAELQMIPGRGERGHRRWAGRSVAMRDGLSAQESPRSRQNRHLSCPGREDRGGGGSRSDSEGWRSSAFMR